MDLPPIFHLSTVSTNKRIINPPQCSLVESKGTSQQESVPIQIHSISRIMGIFYRGADAATDKKSLRPHFMPILITLFLLSSQIRPSDAFSIPVSSIQQHTVFTGRRCSKASLSMSSSSSSSASAPPQLPSAYDIALPASLRGEAVRSALKSDRGTCINFTDDRSLPHSIKNVGVVKVTGKAQSTYNFLNNKLSNSFSENDGVAGGKEKGSKVFNLSPTCEMKVQYGRMKEAGLLTSKGRMIDRLLVATFAGDGDEMEAFMMTSPGHFGSQLFDRLDPFIFPLDGVKLTDMCPTLSQIDNSKGKKGENKCTSVYTFASTDIEVVQNSIRQSVLSTVDKHLNIQLDDEFIFPKDARDCIRYTLSDSTNEHTDMVEMTIFENTFLPSCVARGYTIMITEPMDTEILATKVWDWCTAESNMQGPVELAPLEYETLRIEGGQPAFGFEMTGSLKKSKAESMAAKKKNNEDESKTYFSDRDTKAGPLELHLDHLVDEQKGCYQGQEGVAAMFKNKRGLPQLLYSVVFPEEDNFYDDEERDEEEYSNHNSPDRVKNKTTLPQVGDTLYALGSNMKIKVGTVSSIAERDGTSSSETIGLTMVRRSDGILKKMKEMDLEIERNDFMGMGPEDDVNFENDSMEGSGIFYPPPMDPLDGLDVVSENGFTRGFLRAIPSRRLRSGQNIFEVEEWSMFDDQQSDTGSVMGYIPNEAEEWAKRNKMDMDMSRGDVKEKERDSVTSEIETSFEELSTPLDTPGTRDTDDDYAEEDLDDEELKAAIDAAQKAADEARRKEEKLAMLKKRAEEAMEKRRKAKEAAQKEREMKAVQENEEEKNDTTAAEAEAKRKEEKMEMLRKRAEEAMARRKKKQQ